MDYLQEIAELREELRRHSIAYYDKDAPRFRTLSMTR